MELSGEPRLSRVLGGPNTRRLIERVGERIARGLPLDATISLADPTDAERAAIDQLLGRRPSVGRTISVSLAKLDAVLRSSGVQPDGLAAAIVAVHGPIAVRADEYAAVERAWADAFEPLHEYVAGRRALETWCRDVVSSGLIRRLAETPDAATGLVARLCTVLSALPVASESIGTFAARILGSAHALDDGTPLTTLVFGAAKGLGGAPDGAGASWRRMVWASVGLLRDELSSTVLAVGVPGDDRTATGRALELWRREGQPVLLTLRQLLTDPPAFDCAGLVVSMCENRSVVATAADRLGSDCSPLVCSSGQPGAAVLLLLEQLVAGGAQLRYHGDFDWYGLAIANFLRTRIAWRPWLFETSDYLVAVGAQDTDQLAGRRVEASWDPTLAGAMAEVGKQVEEEQVLDRLLCDLTIR